MKAENNTLTREQMLEALREGKKVTHRYFSYNEWMKLMPGTRDIIVFEDGVRLTIGDFFHYRNEKGWSDGYSIFGQGNT